MRTDHTAQIAAMRALRAIDYTAAADLLEMHDSTGLNLHEAPGLLAFVVNRMESLEKTADINPWVTENFA